MSFRRTILILIAALFVLPAAAAGKTKSASLADVSARVSWSGTDFQPRNLTVTIVKAGRQLYQAPVNVPGFPGCPQEKGRVNCLVGDLSAKVLGNAAGAPSVILTLFTEGAHCCQIVQTFVYRPGTQTFQAVTRNFGDAGATVRNLGRGNVFLSADDNFAYAFTSFVASGLPIQILAIDGERYVDVTGQYRSRVSADATDWWKTFKQISKGQGAETEGIFAAWAADQYRLGHARQVARELKQQQRLGHLTGDLKPARYVTALPRFLKKLGY